MVIWNHRMYTSFMLSHSALPHLVIRTLGIGRVVNIRSRGHEVNKVQPELADVGADLGEGVLARGGVGVGGGVARVLDVGRVLRDLGAAAGEPGNTNSSKFHILNSSLRT